MAKGIYQLNWLITSDVFETFSTEWKVFDSKARAKTYGLSKQKEKNGGLLPEEKAEDGYCYRFISAEPVKEIDGFRISLEPKIDD